MIAAAALALAACQQDGTAANEQADANVAANDQASAAATTPVEVAAMIEQDGAARTVQTLDQGEEDNRFYAVLDGVSSGKQAWLDLVPRLASGTDAGTTTGLTISLAEALQHNAAGVLRAAGDPIGIAEVCSYPMIEPAPEETSAYFAAAIPAVEGVSDPALEAAKTECLGLLRTAQSSAQGRQ